MISLKSIDRIALTTLILASACVPLAVVAAPAPLAVGFSLAGASRAVSGEAASQVRRGMTAEEVLSRLGEPVRRERFERTRTTAWDYMTQDTWGYATQLSVIFDDSGVVVELVRVRIGD